MVEPKDSKDVERTSDVNVDDDLLHIFRDAEKIGNKKNNTTTDISDHVYAVINSCCKNENEIIQLLNRNGFKIYPNRHDTDSPDVDQYYDERIVGEMRAEQFLYVWKTYRIAAYMRNKKIVTVKAYVFQDGL